MASQTPKVPLKGDSREPKKGIKNPTIYAGTIVVLVIVVIAFIFVPMGGGSASLVSGNGRSLDFGNYAGKPVVYSQDSYMYDQVESSTIAIASRASPKKTTSSWPTRFIEAPSSGRSSAWRP